MVGGSKYSPSRAGHGCGQTLESVWRRHDDASPKYAEDVIDICSIMLTFYHHHVFNTRIYQVCWFAKKKTILLITSSSSSVVQLLPSFIAQISRLSCSLDADNFCLLTPHISGSSFVWCFSTMWCPRNKQLMLGL